MPAATDRAEAHLQKHSREELPLAQGQGRRPRVSGCDGTGVAWRSYPTSEVRGGGPDELPHARGQGRRPRGATSRRRSEETPRGATTHPRSGRRRRGATPSPRSGGCAGPGGPRGATPRSRSGGGGCVEIPLLQGKEQRLHFAEAAVKRYPTSKVRETEVRR